MMPRASIASATWTNPAVLASATWLPGPVVGGGEAAAVDAVDDVGEAAFGVVEDPAVAGHVWLHLQCADRDTVRVGELCRWAKVTPA